MRGKAASGALGAAIAALALLLCLPGAAGAQQGGKAAAAGPPQHTPPPRLVVDGQALRDGFGREVILRGISMIQKQAPYLPDYGPADFERVRSWGLNSVRLGISWRGVMPDPWQVDEGYLDRLAELVGGITDAGLYVVIDMHQDVWGGRWGNGAPQWATRSQGCAELDLAGLTGSWQLDYFSPAVICAFTNFWLADDLKRAYGEAWKAVAERVGQNPRVAGYDLFNEPFPGLIPPGVFENSHLYPAQSQWIGQIREARPHAVGFFEPPVTRSVGLPTVPALKLPGQVVYAPHLYGPWDFDQALWETRHLARLSWEHSALEARIMGTPLWLGEFGVEADREGADDFVAQVLDLADSRKAGAAYWEYATSYGPVAPDGSERRVLDGLVRAYPHAVPGRIERLRYVRAERRLELRWRQDAAGITEIQAPARLYPEGIVVEGAQQWTYDDAEGIAHISAGPGRHSVTIAPAD